MAEAHPDCPPAAYVFLPPQHRSAVIVDPDHDEAALAPNALLDASNDAYNPNPTGHFIYLEAQGADCYVAFAAAYADLSAISATTPSTVAGGTGVVTGVAGGTFCIPQGKAVRWRIPPNQNSRDNADVGAVSYARFLGFLTATGSGLLQVYQSSP